MRRTFQPVSICWYRFGLALLAGCVQTCLAATVTLKPAADTTLFSFAVDNNCGKEPTLVVGGINKSAAACRCLLRFDLGTNVPSGAVITKVSLKLRVTKEKGTTGALQTRFHRMNQGWAEGAKTGKAGGSLGANGDVTWKSRQKGTVDWTAPGASGDFETAASATVAIDNTGAYTVESNESLIADVRSWLSNPAGNHGWILVADEEAVMGSARRIAAREDSGQAPALTIEFTTPPPPPSLPLAAGKISADGQLELTFPAQIGVQYQIESRQLLESSSWNPAATVTATQDGVVSQRFPLTEPAGFFRVVLKP